METLRPQTQKKILTRIAEQAPTETPDLDKKQRKSLCITGHLPLHTNKQWEDLGSLAESLMAQFQQYL